MHPSLIIEIVGWAGSIQVVAAYALLSLRKISQDALLYVFFNFFGSVLLIIHTVWKQAYPPATVNTIWAVIALISLGQIILRKWRKGRAAT